MSSRPKYFGISNLDLSYLRLCLPPLCMAVLLSACERQSDERSVDATVPTPAPTAALPRSASPDGARVFFVTPADGDTVSNPVKIGFGIDGMTVLKTGQNQPNSGHHHLIIDAPLPELSLPIPADDNYVHFGDASTSTERTLEPGTHTLQMLLGDHLHIPHDPPVMSDVITIIVQ